MEDYPIYDRILGQGSDPETKVVAVSLGTNQRAGVRIDITLGLVGPLAAALVAEARKLNEQIPEEERNQSATLKAEAVYLAALDDGQICITFELPGGTPLPLQCDASALAGLARELVLLTSSATDRPN